MTKLRFVLVIVLFLVSIINIGCFNSLMGTDASGYPKKEKFDPFYLAYEENYEKVNIVLEQMHRDYDLVKQEKMYIVDFRKELESSKDTLTLQKMHLEKVTAPNGLNDQYSVGYLKQSCIEGISAVNSFLNVNTSQDMGAMNAFESSLEKGIEAKNTSKKYVESIREKIK